GRLSTVIAHEIRNPLMIIKASLHSLRQAGGETATVREAAADIDGEVVRLNRLVNEVLDFARPIQFELSPVSLNTLCGESAAAALASGGGPAIACDLDPALGTLTTDPERLRIALVSLLVNARQATNGDGAQPDAGPPAGAGGPAPTVTLPTAAAGDRARITVADRGAGIAPPDLAQIFDPYFTTKRGGTGLGLPIAKNIVEGLGGTVAVSSTPGKGTEIIIDLPFETAQDTPHT